MGPVKTGKSEGRQDMSLKTLQRMSRTYVLTPGEKRRHKQATGFKSETENNGHAPLLDHR